MLTAVLVAAGSAVGGLGRYLTGVWLRHVCGDGFPWWTLTVNVIGSFLIVFLAGMLEGERMKAFMLIGLLGGFTTFSSFSMDTLERLFQDQVGMAILNVLANVILCLVAAWLGHVCGRGLSVA